MKCYILYIVYCNGKKYLPVIENFIIGVISQAQVCSTGSISMAISNIFNYNHDARILLSCNIKNKLFCCMTTLPFYTFIYKTVRDIIIVLNPLLFQVQRSLRLIVSMTTCVTQRPPVTMTLTWCCPRRQALTFAL